MPEIRGDDFPRPTCTGHHRYRHVGVLLERHGAVSSDRAPFALGECRARLRSADTQLWSRLADNRSDTVSVPGSTAHSPKTGLSACLQAATDDPNEESNDECRSSHS